MINRRKKLVAAFQSECTQLHGFKKPFSLLLSRVCLFVTCHRMLGVKLNICFSFSRSSIRFLFSFSLV